MQALAQRRKGGPEDASCTWRRAAGRSSNPAPLCGSPPLHTVTSKKTLRNYWRGILGSEAPLKVYVKFVNLFSTISMMFPCSNPGSSVAAAHCARMALATKIFVRRSGLYMMLGKKLTNTTVLDLSTHHGPKLCDRTKQPHLL